MILFRVFFVVFLFLYLNMTISACGAEILSQLHPYISVKGEYSDNMNLTANDPRKDFYTTISPGLKFSNMDARSGIDFDGSAVYVMYDKNYYENSNYITANANLNAKYLTSSHVNFYLKESYLRSDSPREKEIFTTTAENKFNLPVQTQRSVYWRNVVAPTAEYQFGPEDRVGINYRYNIYNTEAPLAPGSENSIENYVNPFVTYWFDKQNGVSLDYGYTNGVFQTSPELDGHKVTAAYMRRFTPKATVSLNGAYTNQTFTEPSLNYDIYDAFLGISYIFSPTVTASAQVGYYWLTPKMGNSDSGPTFKADITNRDEHTTYNLSIQGGYTLDYFTSSNLGFQKYYRATGTINHFLQRQFSIGALGSIERTDSGPFGGTTWQGGANASYIPLQWLTFSLQYTYTQKNADLAANDYTENRGMLMVTATY